jgi:hypothetical protein
VSLALAQSGGGDATAGKPSPGQTSGEHSVQRKEFRRFQISYLTVFLITMLADWLQGTNMYTLYSGYDMPVGLLFLTGFISSAVFGTISAYSRLSSRLSIFLDKREAAFRAAHGPWPTRAQSSLSASLRAALPRLPACLPACLHAISDACICLLCWLGTWVGLYVDMYGRKMGCVLFCVLEVVINTLEHFPSLYLLLFGRVLGGISTSLLFSAFESWMVTEHRSRGFPEEWLAATHGLASTGNGIAAVRPQPPYAPPFPHATASCLPNALSYLPKRPDPHGLDRAYSQCKSQTPAPISSACVGSFSPDGHRYLGRHVGVLHCSLSLSLSFTRTHMALSLSLFRTRMLPLPAPSPSKVIAGVVAQVAADTMGDIGPFRVAIGLTVVALAFVLGWSENYGKQDTVEATAVSAAWRDIRTKPSVWLLGAVQALFEGAMFTFVFVWVPTILKV